jgi:hypothetical protein
MPRKQSLILSLVLILGIPLLVTFNRGLILPRWATYLHLDGAVNILLDGLHQLQQGGGSIITIATMFMLMGILLCHSLAFYIVSLLPGQLIQFRSERSAIAGRMIMQVTAMGFAIATQQMLRLIGISVWHLVRLCSAILIKRLGQQLFPKRPQITGTVFAV